MSSSWACSFFIQSLIMMIIIFHYFFLNRALQWRLSGANVESGNDEKKKKMKKKNAALSHINVFMVCSGPNPTSPPPSVSTLTTSRTFLSASPFTPLHSRPPPDGDRDVLGGRRHGNAIKRFSPWIKYRSFSGRDVQPNLSRVSQTGDVVMS